MAPFEVSVPRAAREVGVSTHALSPQAPLRVFVQLHGTPAPPCTPLAIRGERFELGEPPGDAACRHLDAALHWATA